MDAHLECIGKVWNGGMIAGKKWHYKIIWPIVASDNWLYRTKTFLRTISTSIHSTLFTNCSLRYADINWFSHLLPAMSALGRPTIFWPNTNPSPRKAAVFSGCSKQIGWVRRLLLLFIRSSNTNMGKLLKGNGVRQDGLLWFAGKWCEDDGCTLWTFGRSRTPKTVARWTRVNGRGFW